MSITSRFLYLNYLVNATMSASGTTTGYSVDNTVDWREYEIWTHTGANSYWLLGDLGAGTMGDTFADLSNWSETDANNTLSAAAGALTYNSGANANDNPDVTWDTTKTATAHFRMELEFDATAFATADSSEWYWELEFTANYKVRAKVDDNAGPPRVTFQHDANAGSYTTVDSYTLSGGTSGRIYIDRASTGTVTMKVYDDNDSTYHALTAYAGGSNYTATTLASMTIEAYVAVRTGGSMTFTCATLYHADTTGDIKSLALGGHNLNTQGVTQVALQGSVGGVGYTDVVAAFSPSDDYPLAKYFTEEPFRYYKLTLGNGGGSNFTPEIGIWFVGDYLELSWPEQNDPDAFEDETSRSRSGDGYNLGAVRYNSMRATSWTYKYQSQATVDTWLAFLKTYRLDPFFFSWDYSGHDDEVYLQWFKNTRFSAPYDDIYKTISFELEGRKEE